MKVERRKPTGREWRQITRRRTTGRRITQAQKEPKGGKEMR